MKRFLIAILTLLSLSLVLHAQEKFSTYEDMINKEAIIYGTTSCFDAIGPFAYNNNGKNYKPIRDRKEYESFDAVPVRVTNIIEWKKKRFLEINTTLKTYYLLLDDKADYLTMSKNVTYWRERFEQYKAEYKYIPKDCPAISGRSFESKGTGGYHPITWNSLHIPATLKDIFQFDCSVYGKRAFVTDENVTSDKGYLVSNKEFLDIVAKAEADRREKARQDSIADRTCICEALLKHGNTDAYYALKEASSLLDYNQIKDTLVVSVYYADTPSSAFKDRKYKGIVLGYDIEIYGKGLDFLNKEAKEFVESRGFEGISIRKESAKEHDLKQTEEYTRKLNEKTDKINAQLEALYKFYKQKKIFLLSKEYAFDDIQFGLSFEMFNCFDKEIKYIDFVVTAYNVVGDKQKDYLGYSSAKAHCIGPLKKGDEGKWTFSKLFWDEYDVIERLEVTEVKFTFKDNSELKYSGKEKIKLHSLENYADEAMKILHPDE